MPSARWTDATDGAHRTPTRWQTEHRPGGMSGSRSRPRAGDDSEDSAVTQHVDIDPQSATGTNGAPTVPATDRPDFAPTGSSVTSGPAHAAAAELPAMGVGAVAQIGARIGAAMGQVILGKPEVIRLALICLLTEGHLLIEDVPGTGKTSLAKALAKSQRRHRQPGAVHPGPDAQRRHRGQHLRPADLAVRVPARPGVRQHRGGRRDQPRLAEDPVGAAGVPWRSVRSPWTAPPTRWPGHSWCWPPRTRSRWRAPTRCRRRSATGSWRAPRSATPTLTPRSPCSPDATGSTRWTGSPPSPTPPPSPG